jgi:hypothetical protein
VMNEVQLGEQLHEVAHRVYALTDLSESLQGQTFPAFVAGRWLMAVAALAESVRDQALELFTLSHGLRAGSEAENGFPDPELIARIRAVLTENCGGGGS